MSNEPLLAPVWELLQNPAQLVREGKTYLILLPAYVVLLGGERLAHALTQKRSWNNRDSITNLVITGLMMLRDLTLGAFVPLGIIAFLYSNARIVTLPETPLGWIAAFVLYDFCWYVDHWLGHKTGLFWAFHQVHHSSEEYNMTVASRGFIIEFLTRPAFYLMPILGVSPTMYITVKIFTSIWGIAQHTRLIGKLGPLDWLLATPSSHRVHHGSDDKYIDKNYGEVLMIWDHIFGTYQKEEEEPVYGLTKNIHTYNVWEVEVSGLRWLWEHIRSAPRLIDKIRYLYMPPGWEHSQLQTQVQTTPSATKTPAR